MRQTAILHLAALCFSAEAANLVADALVCESEAALQTINADPSLAQRGGAETIKHLGLRIEFADLQQKSAQYLYRSYGERVQAMTKAKDEGIAAERLRAACAALGPAVADVLEVRPLSDLARVRVTINGKPAEVWTRGQFVKN